MRGIEDCTAAPTKWVVVHEQAQILALEWDTEIAGVLRCRSGKSEQGERVLELAPRKAHFDSDQLEAYLYGALVYYDLEVRSLTVQQEFQQQIAADKALQAHLARIPDETARQLVVTAYLSGVHDALGNPLHFPEHQTLGGVLMHEEELGRLPKA